MQNRYAGDIGDFGKLGLLRALQTSGLSEGINWYLVPDEHNGDGRYVDYLEDDDYRACDEPLFRELKKIVDSGERNILALETSSILKAQFYSESLDFSGLSGAERTERRKAWHEEALQRLKGVDVVFADPDNGLIVPSAAGKPKENKYVMPDELVDYYHQNSSVIYYQHQARRDDRFYIDQHRKLIESPDFDGASGRGLKFTRVSLRYFFFIIHPHHEAAIADALRAVSSSVWSQCFSPVDLS